MKHIYKLVAAATLVIGVVAAGGDSASAAKPPYDPNVTRFASPATVCKSIPATVKVDAAFGLDFDLSWFDYSDCVQTLAHGAAVLFFGGNPYQQCDALVASGAFSYPVTLGAGDLFLPDLTVKNRKECGNALYAFSAILNSLQD